MRAYSSSFRRRLFFIVRERLILHRSESPFVISKGDILHRSVGVSSSSFRKRLILFRAKAPLFFIVRKRLILHRAKAPFSSSFQRCLFFIVPKGLLFIVRKCLFFIVPKASILILSEPSILHGPKAPILHHSRFVACPPRWIAWGQEVYIGNIQHRLSNHSERFAFQL